ncbi:MAG: DUF4167 domain-containing protein [Roseovarius sp.]
MRSQKSRSRNKNRNNNNRPSGNIINRVFDSSGPEGKVRGTPQQIIEKYNQLARDAQLAGDRVATENFQQHAEHYLRLLGEAQKEQDAKREEQERQNRERQADRDRERTQRQERESNGGAGSGSDPADAPQPDVMVEAAPVAEDSGLVETPESQPAKPKRPRKPRKPKPEVSDDAGAPASSPEGPAEAAE